MQLYLDTSALVKRYIYEVGTEYVQHLIRQANCVAISIVGKVELISALSRSELYGMDENTIRQAKQAFQQDFQGLVFLTANDEVIHQACESASKHKLRGYDAIHLASAINWFVETNEMVQFVTYDYHLWRAAKTTNLTVLPETLG